MKPENVIFDIPFTIPQKMEEKTKYTAGQVCRIVYRIMIEKKPYMDEEDRYDFLLWLKSYFKESLNQLFCLYKRKNHILFQSALIAILTGIYSFSIVFIPELQPFVFWSNFLVIAILALIFGSYFWNRFLMNRLGEKIISLRNLIQTFESSENTQRSDLLVGEGLLYTRSLSRYIRRHGINDPNITHIPLYEIVLESQTVFVERVLTPHEVCYSVLPKPEREEEERHVSGN